LKFELSHKIFQIIKFYLNNDSKLKATNEVLKLGKIVFYFYPHYYGSIYLYTEIKMIHVNQQYQVNDSSAPDVWLKFYSIKFDRFTQIIFLIFIFLLYFFIKNEILFFIEQHELSYFLNFYGNRQDLYIF
jgi:hypothetical protein